MKDKLDHYRCHIIKNGDNSMVIRDSNSTHYCYRTIENENNLTDFHNLSSSWQNLLSINYDLHIIIVAIC